MCSEHHVFCLIGKLFCATSESLKRFGLVPRPLPLLLSGSPTAGWWGLAAGAFGSHPRSSFPGVMRSDQVIVEGKRSSLRAFHPLVLIGFPVIPLTQILFWYWRFCWARPACAAPLLSAARAVSFGSSPALVLPVLCRLIWIWRLTLPTHLASWPPPVSVALLGNRES